MNSAQVRIKTTIDRRVLLGMGIAVVAAFAYGSGNVIAKMAMDDDKISPVVFTSFSLMFGTMILSVLSVKDIRTGTHIPLRASMLMIGAGISSGFAVLFLVLGLDRATVTLVSPIAALNPIVTLALAYLLLQRLELITKKVVLGTFVAVGGVILVIIGSA